MGSPTSSAPNDSCSPRTTLAGFRRGGQAASRVPQIDASVSENGSLRPRSTSERYCGEMPARFDTWSSVRPCSVRFSRRSLPTSSRHSGSS